MTAETLKQLIEVEYDRCETISQFKSEVFRLIDLYEQDKSFIPTPGFTISEPNEVMYAEICPCNPKNGGSGICGCVMGNKMVPNPMFVKDAGKNGMFHHFTSTTDKTQIDPDKIIKSDPEYINKI